MSIHILYSSLVQCLSFKHKEENVVWSAPVPGFRCPASGRPRLHPHLDRRAGATGSSLVQRRLQALACIPTIRDESNHRQKKKKKKKSKSISARVFPEINAPRSRFQTQPGWEPSPPRIVSSAEITQTDRVRPLQGREACDPSSITAAGTPFTRRTVGIHRPAGRPSSASPGLMAAEAGCAGRPPLAAIRGLWGPERSRQASAPGCSATAPAQRPAAVASRNAQAGESRPPEQRRSGRRAGATPRAAALAAAVQGGTRTLGRSAVVAVAAEPPGPREPVPLRPSCEPEWRRRRRRLWRRRRRWRKWSGEEGVVVSVWRRRRESFLQLHFRSAFCSERERRNERERHTHRAPSPPPALPPSLRRYRLTRHQRAAGRDAPADRRIGSRARGDAPPVARAPARVFVSVSMWEKEEEEEEAAICLLGWSPPGSTCSLHWGDGRGAVATPPPGPDYSLSPQRPRPPLGSRRRFAQVNSCSLFRRRRLRRQWRRRRRRRQVLSVSPPLSPPRRFLSGPRSLPRGESRVRSFSRRRAPWVAAGLVPPLARPAWVTGKRGLLPGGRGGVGPAESAGRGPAESTWARGLGELRAERSDGWSVTGLARERSRS